MVTVRLYFPFYLLILIISCTGSNQDRSEISESHLEEEKDNDVDCRYNNTTITIGNGLLIPREGVNSFEISFFNDSLLVAETNRFNYNSKTERSNFCAKYHDFEYGIFYFICTRVFENSFEIISNYSDTSYVSKQSDYRFISWKERILNSSAIRFSDTYDSYNLFLEPDSLSESKIFENADRSISFCVEQISGEWIKVQYNCLITKRDDFDCDTIIAECDKKRSGWIKWKHNDQLIITVPILP